METKKEHLTPAGEIKMIRKHFNNLYADEIAAGEVNGNVIHEWWSMTKEQYSDNVTFEDVEAAILDEI